MIRFYMSCRIENSPDLLDMIFEIKWMEVQNQYCQRKTLLSFSPESLSQVLSRVHAIQLLFGIVSPHGNVDLHEYKLL